MYITNIGGCMSVTQIDLDDEALTEVLRRSGLKTKKEAVNEALRDYAAKLRRAAEFDGYIRRAQEWDYEGWKELRARDKSGTP
jgi:Arc/MetJ family transcription regulator